MSIKAGLSFACIKIQRGADNLHDVILEGTPDEGKLLEPKKKSSKDFGIYQWRTHFSD